ncbi:hypothetical protein QQ045_007235 [Rhodiola kirilowii]
MDNQSSNNMGSGGSATSLIPNDKPLWNFVVNRSETGKKGEFEWKCKLCKMKMVGTYMRLKAHLLKLSHKGIAYCKVASMEQVREMRRLEEEYEAKLIGMAPQAVPLPSCPSVFTSSAQVSNYGFGASATKKRRNDFDTAKSFDNPDRNELDCLIARMFYTSGLPFTLARNPDYLRSYTFAASHNLGSYVPPGYDQIRTTLLDKERRRVDLLLAPIKSTWRAKGVTIVSNGWSDPSKKPLINIMVCCESGPMFIKAVDCSGEVKSRDFIACLLRKVIDGVGHENVVQVITDNSTTCMAAGLTIEGMYPHIYWTPCVVHTLNLALKNICSAKNVNNSEEIYAECHWIAEIHRDVVQIKNFIVNHSMRLSIYMHFSPLKLLSVAETRFASVVILLKRFKLVKQALKAMVLSEGWSLYEEDDLAKARFVRETIFKEDWWDKVDYILGFTTPISDMIRVCDTNKPCLHLVYEMWDVMIEKVKKAIYEHGHTKDFDTSTFYEAVYKILSARWAKSNTPLHCLAYSLNPKYYGNEWLGEDLARKPPHSDDEVSKERRMCFKRLFPCHEEYDKVLTEFGNFSLGRGSFGDSDAIKMRDTMDPRYWWANFGAAAPFLQALAIRLLGQPTSSSCAERNWSTYSFINSAKRNNSMRAEDLVFIHNNLRLLSRSKSEYLGERTKMWDVGGDEFGTLEDTSILEFADLSLDEPEMENVFFEDDPEELAQGHFVI